MKGILKFFIKSILALFLVVSALLLIVIFGQTTYEWKKEKYVLTSDTFIFNGVNYNPEENEKKEEGLQYKITLIGDKYSYKHGIKKDEVIKDGYSERGPYQVMLSIIEDKESSTPYEAVQIKRIDAHLSLSKTTTSLIDDPVEAFFTTWTNSKKKRLYFTPQDAHLSPQFNAKEEVIIEVELILKAINKRQNIVIKKIFKLIPKTEYGIIKIPWLTV